MANKLDRHGPRRRVVLYRRQADYCVLDGLGCLSRLCFWISGASPGE